MFSDSKPANRLQIKMTNSCVIPLALYPAVLSLYHCDSSDYIFTPWQMLVGWRALVDPLLSYLSGSSR